MVRYYKQYFSLVKEHEGARIMVMVGIVGICMWWFSRECIELMRHLGHARRRTAVIMMTDYMVTKEQTRDSFCRVAWYSM
jgi:hypothetical protein